MKATLNVFKCLAMAGWLAVGDQNQTKFSFQSLAFREDLLTKSVYANIRIKFGVVLKLSAIWSFGIIVSLFGRAQCVICVFLRRRCKNNWRELQDSFFHESVYRSVPFCLRHNNNHTPSRGSVIKREKRNDRKRESRKTIAKSTVHLHSRWTTLGSVFA